jgi:hypothetical protein
MRVLFFWTMAAATCLGGALVAIQAEAQGDMLSVAVIMCVCFIVSVVFISDSHDDV